MIKFKRISIKNFGSVGNQPLEIQLDRHPLTVVTGQNGQGKSVVTNESIVFALYGTSYRGLKKKQLINSINGRDCVVEIEFENRGKEYKVLRGMKPDRFTIWENGKALEESAGTRDQQRYLETVILGMNYKTFKQVTILSVSDYVPFMNLSTKDRRGLIEELLDIQIFSVMNEVLGEKRNEIKELKNKLNQKQQLLEVEVRSQTQKIESLKAKDITLIESNLQKIGEVQTLITERIEEIEGLHQQIEELTQQLPNLPEVQQRKSKLDVISSKIQDAYTRLNKDIEFFTSHDNCPVCSQEIGQELKDEVVTAKKEKQVSVEKAECDITKQLQELSQTIREASEVNSKIRELNQTVSSLNSSVLVNQKYIKELEYQNETLRENSEEEERREAESLKKMLGIGEKLGGKLQEIGVTEEDYQVCLKLLKDDGIKTQIIEKFIPTINKMLNHYLEAFNFSVSFTFDNNFNEVVRSRYRDEFTYNNFSAGERARIDACITLTFRELAKLRNSVSTNLLIIDEIFENLDIGGIQRALEILEGLSDVHTFLITHKTEIQEAAIHRIVLKKHEGFTIIT